MPQIVDLLYDSSTPDWDKAESDRLNRERKGMDNEWLFSKVQEKWLTQEAFTQLQIIKDMCQFIYPDNWDIELVVNSSKIKVEIQHDVEPLDPNPRPIQLMGAYFGYELPEPGARYPDDEEYYMQNYLNPDNFMYYNDTNMGREHDDNNSRNWHSIAGPKYLTFRIIVHFPEFTLTNSEGASRQIFDFQLSALFAPPTNSIQILQRTHSNSVINNDRIGLRFDFEFEKDGTNYTVPFSLNKYILIEGLSSRRQTVTKQEYMAHFSHSHSQQRSKPRDYMSWGKCCLGSEGDIRATFMMLSGEFSPEMFTLWLHQLEAYAEWESLEGGPHIRMSSITKGGVLADFPNINSNTINSFIKNVYNNKRTHPEMPTPLDWQVTPEGGLKIIDNSKLQDFCRIYSDVQSYPINIAYHKTIEGRLYQPITGGSAYVAPASYDMAAGKFIYQGQDRLFNIIEDPEQAGIQLADDFVIHPQIINNIKIQFERHASSQKIRDDIARRANQANNQSRNISENPISLPRNT